MSLEHAILGFLNERPRSGYDLKTRCFDRTLRPLWTADQAQIYRTLERLERDKLVSSRRKRQSGKPDRKIFEITHAGREALAEWASRPHPLPNPRDAFLVQTFFAALVEDEKLLGVLKARRDAHQERLDELREHSKSASQESSVLPRDALLHGFALNGAIAEQRALIDWLDDCIDDVNGGLPGSGGPDSQRQLFGLEGA